MQIPGVHSRAISLLFALSLFGGCEALDFELKERTSEVILDGDPQGAAAGVLLPSDQIPTLVVTPSFENSPDAIRVQAVTLSLTRSVPDAVNRDMPFEFVEVLEFWIAPTNTSSGLAEIQLAALPPGRDGPNLPLDVASGVDLTPYLREGAVIRPRFKATVPAEPVSFVATFVFDVDVL